MTSPNPEITTALSTEKKKLTIQCSKKRRTRTVEIKLLLETKREKKSSFVTECADMWAKQKDHHTEKSISSCSHIAASSLDQFGLDPGSPHILRRNCKH